MGAAKARRLHELFYGFEQAVARRIGEARSAVLAELRAARERLAVAVSVVHDARCNGSRIRDVLLLEVLLEFSSIGGVHVQPLAFEVDVDLYRPVKYDDRARTVGNRPC